MAAPLFEIAVPEGPEEAPAILLRVHLVAGAGRSEVTGSKESALIVRMASPPRHAHSNTEVQRVAAELFGVEADAVRLLAGDSGADKLLRIAGVTEEDATRVLDQARRSIAAAPRARRTDRAPR